MKSDQTNPLGSHGFPGSRGFVSSVHFSLCQPSHGCGGWGVFTRSWSIWCRTGSMAPLLHLSSCRIHGRRMVVMDTAGCEHLQQKMFRKTLKNNKDWKKQKGYPKKYIEIHPPQFGFFQMCSSLSRPFNPSSICWSLPRSQHSVISLMLLKLVKRRVLLESLRPYYHHLDLDGGILESFAGGKLHVRG